MVDDIYNDFKNGNNVHDTTLHYIKLLNGGRLTKKSNLLAKRFHNTLRLFENLDNEDLANILIEQYLAPDSIKTFEDKNKGVLTW
jgi:hypothetical protein